ncbi:hypothetical protein [Algibacter sp. L1A34]|uniref:hypothetical protein n=1 Tax=Algibacter sp. L1A34 TaxID=2686365 RepID=UPI00131D01FF|nr:hypothetical protein [Algibacter sp. L1A34]
MTNYKNFKQLIIKEKWLLLIILVSVISSLRSLLVPLFADELTYNKLGDSILSGRYYLINYPSTVTPIIPLLFALFKIKALPVLGFTLHKLFNIVLVIFALRYIYFFLKKQDVNSRIALTIVALTMVNPIAINSFSSLYPEALLFFCFWGFMYYSNLEYSNKSLLKMLLFFTVLILTRYVYAVLGLLVLIVFIRYLKNDRKQYLIKILKYSIIVLIPIGLWIKYVYNIEQNNLSEISYFDRFKIDNPLLYNIKCGLGFIQHHEVGKINGVPAFASLFVPITGFRHYIISTLIISAFILGYIFNEKTYGIKMLFFAIILVLLGFVFAGTGFSRYWLVLLPGFFLGFYFLWRKFKLKDIWFIYASQTIAVLYIINEIRLDFLVINNNL